MQRRFSCRRQKEEEVDENGTRRACTGGCQSTATPRRVRGSAPFRRIHSFRQHGSQPLRQSRRHSSFVRRSRRPNARADGHPPPPARREGLRKECPGSAHSEVAGDAARCCAGAITRAAASAEASRRTKRGSSSAARSFQPAAWQVEVGRLPASMSRTERACSRDAHRRMQSVQ